MTQQEADKIARVLSTADGGCSNCVVNLCEEINKEKLGFRFGMTGEKRFEQWEGEEEGLGHQFPRVIAVKEG